MNIKSLIVTLCVVLTIGQACILNQPITQPKPNKPIPVQNGFSSKDLAKNQQLTINLNHHAVVLQHKEKNGDNDLPYCSSFVAQVDQAKTLNVRLNTASSKAKIDIKNQTTGETHLQMTEADTAKSVALPKGNHSIRVCTDQAGISFAHPNFAAIQLNELVAPQLNAYHVNKKILAQTAPAMVNLSGLGCSYIGNYYLNYFNGTTSGFFEWQLANNSGFPQYNAVWSAGAVSPNANNLMSVYNCGSGTIALGFLSSSLETSNNNTLTGQQLSYPPLALFMAYSTTGFAALQIDSAELNSSVVGVYGYNPFFTTSPPITINTDATNFTLTSANNATTQTNGMVTGSNVVLLENDLAFTSGAGTTFTLYKSTNELIIDTNACEGCNLQGIDLSGYNLSSKDLKNANLLSANLSDANINATNLTSANLNSAKISNIQNLNTAILQQTNFSNVSFFGMNLSNFNLANNTFSSADFSSTNLLNANFSNAKMDHAILDKVSNINTANFTGTNLQYVNMNFFDLHGVQMPNADLTHAQLSYALLTDANFAGAILTNTDMSGVYFYPFAGTPTLAGATLTNTNLNDAFLMGLNLNGAKFANPNFSNAILIAATLTSINNGAGGNANAINANFSGANLSGANMTGSNFNGSNFTNAIFSTVSQAPNTCSLSTCQQGVCNNSQSSGNDIAPQNAFSCSSQYLTLTITVRAPYVTGASGNVVTCQAPTGSSTLKRACLWNYGVCYGDTQLPSNTANITCPNGNNGPCSASSWNFNQCTDYDCNC